MKTLDFILATVAGVITTSTFWPFLGNYLAQKRKKKQKREIDRGLRKIAKIYKRMESLERHGAERVILFAGHNNGGIPRLTCGFWVSSIFSHVATDHIDKSKEYSNLPVDSGYVSMLIQAQDRGHVRQTVSDMPTCQLKRYYEAEGVTDALIFFLGIHEKKFMYISMASYDKLFSDKQITNLLLGAQAIKNDFDALEGEI